MAEPSVLAMRSACARCAGALEADDLRCPVCGLTTPQRERPGVEKTALTVVRCPTCRATMAWSAEARAPKCAYCGAQTDLQVPEDPTEQAEAFVPFRVTPAAAREALRQFLERRRWLRPSRLGRDASLATLQALWWPAWVVDAAARVSWTVDSDLGSGRAPWAPHAGQHDLEFRGMTVSASRGLSAAETAQLAGGYQLATALKEPPAHEAAMIERFEVRRSAARERVQEAIERQAEAALKGGLLPGGKFRKLHAEVLLTALTTHRYALPAYVMAYRYGSKLYRVVVHGQNPGLVLGKTPLSPWKVAGLVLGIAAAIAAVVAGVMLSQ